MMSFLAGWIALGAGLLNLLLRKGTRGHRALGLLFVISMALAAIEALSRDAADGLVDLFVGLTLLGCALTIWAVLPFLQRRPGWVERHARRMQGAYIALAAAAANEIVVSSAAPNWPLGIAVTVLTVAAGGWLAARQQREVRRVAAEFG